MANEDLLLRQMPHSLEGEQAVLGSMLIDADCVKDVMDKLRPSDFYLRQNREIFETIYSMFTYAKPIDGITVCEEMQKAEAEATAEKLKECMVKLTAKAGNGGRLFGAVTTKEISDGLRQQFGIDIPKQKLVLDEPIKAFGSYQVKAKLGFEDNGTVYVSVFEEK